MNKPYFLIQILIVSIFGLISCGPDKPTDQEGAQPTLKAEIENLDQSFQKINNTKSLKVTSSLSLTASQKTMKMTTVSADTNCTTNFLQNKVARQTQFTFQPKIAVKNILPPEVFTPTENNDAHVFCDIKILYLNGKKPIASITLRSVEISDTESFSNHDFEFINKAKQPYFYRNGLGRETVSLPIQKGRALTLCEKQKHENQIQASSSTVVEFFPEELFEKKNFQKCRMVFLGDSSGKVWVSKIFFVQNKIADLQIDIKHISHGTPIINDRFEPLLSIEVYNNSDVDTFYKLVLPVTFVNVVPIYTGLGPSPHVKLKSYNLPNQWQISGLKPFSKETINGKDFTIYKLAAHQSLTLNLVSNTNLICPQFLVNTMSQQDCYSNRGFLSGYIYEVNMLPIVLQSQFDNFSKAGWRQFDLTPQNKSLNDIEFWVRNEEMKKHCPNIKIESAVGQNIFAMPLDRFPTQPFCR